MIMTIWDLDGIGGGEASKDRQHIARKPHKRKSLFITLLISYFKTGNSLADLRFLSKTIFILCKQLVARQAQEEGREEEN